MPETVLPFSEFRENVRKAVLASLDQFTTEVMGTPKAHGWKDHELPALFLGVDAHACRLAERINEGKMDNSAQIRIDMGS